MSIDRDLLDRLMAGRSSGDLLGKTGIVAELTKALAERALSTEMDFHLDEERAEPAPESQNQPPNRRNGSSQKTVTTDSGKVVLDIPRDRNGTFDPLLIAKYQRRFPIARQAIAKQSAVRGVRPQDRQHVRPRQDDPRDPGSHRGHLRRGGLAQPDLGDH
jgi:putative transposase